MILAIVPTIEMFAWALFDKKGELKDVGAIRLKTHMKSYGRNAGCVGYVELCNVSLKMTDELTKIIKLNKVDTLIAKVGKGFARRKRGIHKGHSAIVSLIFTGAVAGVVSGTGVRHFWGPQKVEEEKWDEKLRHISVFRKTGDLDIAHHVLERYGAVVTKQKIWRGYEKTTVKLKGRILNGIVSLYVSTAIRAFESPGAQKFLEELERGKLNE